MFPWETRAICSHTRGKTAGFSRSRAALCSEPLADKGTFFCNKDNMLLAK